MTVLKPIHVVCEQTVSLPFRRAVIEGIKEVLRIAGASQLITIRDFGVWRTAQYLDHGRLRPFHSVDWYVQVGRAASTRQTQLDGSAIMDAFVDEPWQRADPHYDVMVLRSDMYCGTNNFVLGVARKQFASIISIDRFLNNLWQVNPLEALKTTAMHEIGHVFGLIPEERTVNVEESLGKHCTNRCLMRQRLEINGWNELTRDHLHYGAFCRVCEADLRAYFAQRPVRNASFRALP